MRIVAYLDQLDLPVAGVLEDGRVVTLAALVDHAGLREELALLDVRGLLAEDEDLAETRTAFATAVREGLRGVPTSELCLVAPLEPGKIVCVGSNYRSHVEEQGQPIPDRPLLFAKFSNTVIGDNCVIGPGAMISNSVIWGDVVVGHSAELSYDVVGTKCSIGEKSVIAENAFIGDGCWIGRNARLKPRLPRLT